MTTLNIDKTIFLKNKNLFVEIDKPGAIYRGARFDWTGFIRQITYNQITFCTTEINNSTDVQNIGAGLCNEFGITSPVGYEDCSVGNQFIKIGVGKLKRETADSYSFMNKYDVVPAEVEYYQKSDQIVSFISQAKIERGFGYKLEKEISIDENCFKIKYLLFNNGTESIITNEYCHNFLSFNRMEVSNTDELVVSFSIIPGKFKETVNPEGVVNIGANNISWKDKPKRDFFFSNLGSPVDADFNWKLSNKDLKISIAERVFPVPSEMNLWGTSHVVSPEIFVPINLKPGESFNWERNFIFS
jgi:hypothetical protein